MSALAQEHPNHVGGRPDPDCPKCRGGLDALKPAPKKFALTHPLCPHGLNGKKCDACGRVDCIHPGALPHDCPASRGSHA